MPELLTRDDLIALLHVSKQTVRRYEREGILKPLRISPRVIRFTKSDVEKLLAEVKEAGQ